MVSHKFEARYHENQWCVVVTVGDEMHIVSRIESVVQNPEQFAKHTAFMLNVANDPMIMFRKEG